MTDAHLIRCVWTGDSPKAPPLDADTLRRILHYDPTIGEFTWRARHDVRAAWNTRYAGRLAGFDWRAGTNVTYRSIRVFDWPRLAHRLAWLYMTGEWPLIVVDHIDRNGLNNAWSNLRAATKSQNAANSSHPITNTTGFKGVSLCKIGKFRATIRIDGRQKWLGRFSTAEEAARAYRDAAIEKSGEYAVFP